MNLQLGLPELRKARNITIKDMAERLNISIMGYRNKEAGEQPISIDEKLIICQILECPLEYLWAEDAARLRKLLEKLEVKEQKNA